MINQSAQGGNLLHSGSNTSKIDSHIHNYKICYLRCNGQSAKNIFKQRNHGTCKEVATTKEVTATTPNTGGSNDPFGCKEKTGILQNKDIRQGGKFEIKCEQGCIHFTKVGYTNQEM